LFTKKRKVDEKRPNPINVYEYGREGKCLYMFRYTYAGFRGMRMQMEKESRHMSRAMRTSIGTVT